MELLADRTALKAEVVRCFKQVAGSSTGVDIQGLQSFRTLLSRAIAVPRETLGDLHASYIRFDFDGDGQIDLNEAYKLVKHHLWAHLKTLGCVGRIDVPRRTLGEAGYTVVKELGRGNQGVAMLASDAAGRERCVKRYEKGNMTVGGIAELMDEFETMQRLSCNMIAHACAIFQDTGFYYIVGEAYHGGDLCTLRDRAAREKIDMTEQWWRGIFSQCFQALAFVHEQAMMHCDIKEPNIMLKTGDLASPEVVLIDFGLSRAMAAEDDGRIFGTPGYVPPETWTKKMWFPRGDVFSMGVVMLQVVGDQVPSTHGAWGSRGLFVKGCASYEQVRVATLTREPPFHLMPGDMPGLTAVTRRLLRKQVHDRPRAPQVLQDDWFQADSSSPSLKERASQHPLRTIGISSDLYEAM